MAHDRTARGRRQQRAVDSGNPFTLIALPPERRRSSLEATAACGTCCCCCVHSLSGVISAVVVSCKPHPGRGPAALLYWSSLLVLALLQFGLVEGAIGLLLLLPAVQLEASIVSLVLASVIPLYDRRAVCRRILGITLWSLVWALIGIVFMIMMSTVM